VFVLTFLQLVSVELMPTAILHMCAYMYIYVYSLITYVVYGAINSHGQSKHELGGIILP
jgi:hypothetical protein